MTSNTTVDLPYGITPPGFRLPAGTHIGRVRLQVADLERSIAYYETVIGLRVLRREAERAWLAPHDDDTVIVELHEKAGVNAVPRRGRIGLYHFAILLPDRASLGRFVRHLAEIGAHAGMSDHFVSEAVYLTDPDGLGIEVYADRPRSAWRFEDRQLAMTTAPLDVRDLVASAGDAPWTGAPRGTRIGHVHLYVRDVDEAAAFYHAALGFDKVVWNYPGALFLSAGGYHHHLGTNTWATGAPLATDDDARLIEWEIVLPDEASLAAAAASLEQAGHTVKREPAGVAARDPWGTQLRL
ncbi:MAG TPA: VOC family protein, partial [Gemmatimonadaceae bacterium]|nr:VOC family protein [Gemmatimonadaceae bacterium]